MKQTLTELENKILSFINAYISENEGRSPVLTEIGGGCGVKSVGTLHRYVSSIEKKGFLKKEHSRWRALHPTHIEEVESP